MAFVNDFFEATLYNLSYGVFTDVAQKADVVISDIAQHFDIHSMAGFESCNRAFEVLPRHRHIPRLD
jgi:hypothetical protein